MSVTENLPRLQHPFSTKEKGQEDGFLR